MKLVIGGYAQGKLEYVKKKYNAKEDFIFALLTNLLYLGLAFILVRYIGIYGIIISIFIQGMTYIGLKTYYIRKRDLRGYA